MGHGVVGLAVAERSVRILSQEPGCEEGCATPAFSFSRSISLAAPEGASAEVVDESIASALGAGGAGSAGQLTPPHPGVSMAAAAAAAVASLAATQGTRLSLSGLSALAGGGPLGLPSRPPSISASPSPSLAHGAGSAEGAALQPRGFAQELMGSGGLGAGSMTHRSHSGIILSRALSGGGGGGGGAGAICASALQPSTPAHAHSTANGDGASGGRPAAVAAVGSTLVPRDVSICQPRAATTNQMTAQV